MAGGCRHGLRLHPRDPRYRTGRRAGRPSMARRAHPPGGQLSWRHRRPDVPLWPPRRSHRRASDRAGAGGRSRKGCLMTLDLGRIGAWFNPQYDEGTRRRVVVEAEALGYPTAWLGGGRRSWGELEFIEEVLDATSTITVATAIVNMWTNDAATIARAYQRIAQCHPDRLLLGLAIGHPESLTDYRRPYDTIVDDPHQPDPDG